jgi:hypothetical protein
MKERFDWLISSDNIPIFVIKNSYEDEVKFVQTRGLTYWKIPIYKLDNVLELFHMQDNIKVTGSVDSNCY